MHRIKDFCPEKSYLKFNLGQITLLMLRSNLAYLFYFDSMVSFIPPFILYSISISKQIIQLFFFVYDDGPKKISAK